MKVFIRCSECGHTVGRYHRSVEIHTISVKMDCRSDPAGGRWVEEPTGVYDMTCTQCGFTGRYKPRVKMCDSSQF